jgi:hypothetical protein
VLKTVTFAPIFIHRNELTKTIIQANASPNTATHRLFLEDKSGDYNPADRVLLNGCSGDFILLIYV